MNEDTTILPFRQSETIVDPLTELAREGEWRATAVSADPHSIGFHISARYAPLGWKSWRQIAREWLAAQGSEEMLRAARNTLLGETWVESGGAPEWQRLRICRATPCARPLMPMLALSVRQTPHGRHPMKDVSASCGATIMQGDQVVQG
jgi:hypothetical protein